MVFAVPCLLRKVHLRKSGSKKLRSQLVTWNRNRVAMTWNQMEILVLAWSNLIALVLLRRSFTNRKVIIRILTLMPLAVTDRLLRKFLIKDLLILLLLMATLTWKNTRLRFVYILTIGVPPRSVVICR